ncbi:alpha-2-macroglobulin precursor [Heterocephalus glaber]|uniref:Alpha-2-macroglobulin n=1 Tax=Heterocephalus glaber TaxID=10181 RepID=E3VX34_HETGA|nr:alpha-2-macroglobulin precursor [Heterocephalus glaber]ADP20502.1 alpha-2-macroglobulin precursor [Heterocephalus glaber]
MGNSKLLHPSLVLLLLVLLPADASTSGKPHYMVLVPSLLHSGTPEKGCLLLSQLNETVAVRASLESIRGNRSLFTDVVADKDLFQCVTFTVPQASSPEEVMFLTVKVRGPTHEFQSRRTVLVKNKESLVFVQTDKPIYKPGQTVKARAVSLDENFRPMNELFPLIFIQDPKGNRVMQWQNLKLEHGLTQLAFPLSSEPLQGSYRMVVQKESGGRIEHPFTVEEFVLPKFEVQVTMPQKITILEEEFTVSVCGRYTYGKPVPGNMTLSICRNYNNPSRCFGRESQAFCKKFSQQLNGHGCFSQQVKTNAFQLKRKEYEMQLQAEAKIQEEGTGVQLTGTGSSEITTTITKLSFVKVDSHFRPGVPFFGQVRLVDGKDIPMPHKTITISAVEANYSSNATTDKDGLAQFSINTTKVIGTSLSVWVKYKDSNPCYDYQWLSEGNEEARHTANAVFSSSQSFVHLEPKPGKLPCGQTQTVQAHYVLKGQGLQELVFYYLIMAKGGIVLSGTHVVSVEQGNSKGHFLVSVPVESDLAPVARLLIYAILPDGEMIGDSAKYEVENCLANKVGLSFSPAQSLPASDTRLRVTAAPQSLCALRAVDQSVLLLRPEAELSASSIYELLPVKDLTGYPGSLNSQEENNEDCISLHNTYIGGILYSPVSNTNEKDMYGFLKDMGLKVFTNSKIRKPKLCAREQEFVPQPMAYARYSEGSPFRGAIGMGIPMDVSSPLPPKEIVRKYFPETWIWDLVVADSSGVAEVEVTVPDTITEWKAGAFCLSSDSGLGLSPTASVRAFQPFFVELTMPYSVVRGEAFTLKATVLNYLPDCIRVSVQLEASPRFLAVPVGKEQESYCICGNARQTVSWAVTPKSLGKVNFTVSAEALESSELCGNEKTVVPAYGKKDTVIKPLLVEPEGIEKEATLNSLLCPSGTEVSEKLSLKLPSGVVEESARASVSILGDLLGSAMQNIHNLLQMPYGCGEQNMVLFAPNIYVLDYLNETQQLTPETRSKAIGYLSTGYQRQLNYKHHDGSYSTFGERHGMGQGNTWLTAFVLKTFAQARKYIFIDEMHLTQALIWLSQKQKDNGCFRSSGSLLNNAIKGGIEDEVTLSAYITIALLEIPLQVTHPVVRNALFCLDSAWKSAKEGAHGSHVYTKALLAYAFALAGNQDKRKEILNSLEGEGVKEDNSIHWARPQKPREPERYLYQPQAPSAEVEMTAYVLLAHLTAQPAPTPEELTSAARIVNWVTKQQNSQGGFSSTQDTVVALHALSKYGAATFTRTGKAAQVTIQSSATFSTNFQVDNNNRLLLQQVSLPTVPGEYSARVTGEGCVYLQTSLKYNVLPEKGVFPFVLEVQTLPPSCDGPKAHTSFQISLNVSYTGNRPTSNMAIVDVKMVSGFIPLKPTVKKLETSDHVNRTEVSNNHVLIYLDKVSNQTLSLSFFTVQDIEVRDLKPAIVKVYDYYETNEFAIAEYYAPCSKDPGNA